MQLVVRVPYLNGECILVNSQAPYLFAIGRYDSYGKKFVKVPGRNLKGAVRKRGCGIDDRLPQVVRAPLRTDYCEFRSHGSAFALDDMAGRTAAALVNSASFLDIANIGGTRCSPERSDIGHELPLLAVGRAPDARHATVRKPVTNDGTKRVVVLRARERRTVQVWTAASRSFKT